MITTLSGTNSFSLQAALQAIMQSFSDKYDASAIERLDATDTSRERLSEALTSLPFLTPRKLVIIRQGSANKQFTEQAEALLPGVADTVDVVFVEPKPDKRSNFYKLLKKATDFKDFPELDAGGLARWLVEAAKRQDGNITPADAAYLVQRVGTNQQLLSMELAKLLLYNPRVSRPAIDAMTDASPQSTIFELLDAAFAGNSQRALALYEEQRALKVEPLQIIAMLSWQLHIMALIKTAGQRSPEMLAADAKVSPYTVKKSLGIARRLPLTQLKALIRGLLDIDQRSKHETLDIDDALRLYIIKLAQ